MQKTRILIVEDETAIAKMIAMNLRVANYDAVIYEDGAEVTPVVLVETGIVKAEKSGIKILGNGELTKKLTVEAVKFSKSAKEAIEKAGGKVEVL